VSTQEGKEFAEKHKMLFIESSAKTDTSKVLTPLPQIFTELAHEVLRKIAKGEIDPKN
jgi:hypothetical protein